MILIRQQIKGIILIYFIIAFSQAFAQNGPEINEKYIESIGGREKLEKVNTLEMTVKSIINGTELEMTTKRMAPNKMVLIRKSEAMLSTTIYNAGKGYVLTAKDTVKMKEEERKSFEKDALIFPEMYYKDRGYTLNFKEKVKYNDSISYLLVEVHHPYGDSYSNFYNTNNYLLEMMVDGEKNITYFNDYRAVDGVKFPFEIKYLSSTSSLTFHIVDIKVNTKIEQQEFELSLFTN